MFKQKDISFKLAVEFVVLAVCFLVTVSLGVVAAKTASDSAYKLCEEYTVLSNGGKAESLARVQREYKQAATRQKVLLTFVVIFAVADGGLLFVVFRTAESGVQAPINQLKQLTDELARGNFNVDIDYNSEGDLGELADNIRAVTANLDSYVRDIQRCMDTMASGDFNTGLTQDFKGEFNLVKASTDNIILSFNDLITQITAISQELSASSQEVFENTQTLTDAALGHENGIIKLTDDINGIADDAHQGVSKVGEVSSCVQKFGGDVEASRKTLQELVDAINSISENTRKINATLKSIDTIASQTSVIALNASFAAAKSGEVGAGFAVVADEVRALAEKITLAVRETSTLIAENDRAIEKGVETARNAENSMKSVVNSSADVEGAVKDISDMSENQSQRLNKLRETMRKMSENVKGNSFATRRNSEASRSLAERVESLKSLVANFRLR